MQEKTLPITRVLSTALVFMLLTVAKLLNAQNFTVGDLNYYVFDGTNVQVNGHVNGTAATGPLTIPETVTYNGTTYTVTKIRYSAFDSCSGLTGSLTIPNSVTIIDNGAFRNCSGFTGTLTLPNNLTKITASVFYGCSGFTGSLIIPNTVTEIWSSAFAGCSGFTGSLVIPNNVESIDWAAFQGCSGFNGPLTIPNSVEVIYYHAFENCTGLTGDLNIPNSVTTIEEYAFAGCSGFDGSLTISNNVTSIRSNAFSGCSGLTGSLVIPDNVTSIGSNAFSGCSSLSGPLVIPDNVTSIGGNAFSGCSSFSDTLSLGASLTGIGNNAFFGACGNFTALNVWAEVPPTLGTEAFTSIDYSIPLSIPNGTCNAYQNASGWDAFVNINMLEPDQGFEITATANPAEAGTIKGICRFSQGQTCTLTATPNSGYVFTNWTENGEVVSTNIVYSFTVEEDRDLVANFVVSDFHPYVNLGLPSGTLWATYNLGAESPAGYGNSFTWGQTQPDVATANWGGDWRMPTGVELQELCDNTTFTWTIRNGVNGALFTASNGNSVFLPAVYINMWWGYQSSIWSNDMWVLGYGKDGDNSAYQVYNFSEYYYENPDFSCFVRPVRTSTQIPTHVINVTANHAEFGEVSGGGSYLECSECTVTATTSNEDCMFAYWKENDEIISMNTTYTFTVTEDRNLVACFFHPDFHEYVDLGLPSGTMWATCNVGSCYPEQDFSTTPYYSWGCDYCEDSGLTKYCNNPEYGVNGYSDTLTTLLPEDDVATYEWGVGWRTPTAEEWEELTQNTTFTWKLIYNNGEVIGSGALFTAPNGNSVFLPAINRKYDPSITFFDNEQGPFYYWTSSLDTINPSKAYHISGDPATYEMGSSSRYNYDHHCCIGLCVRPVLSSIPSDFYTVSVMVHPEEGGTVTGTGEYSFGETCSLTAIPNENFVFTNWKKDGVVVSTDATYSFRVYGNCSYEACFVHSNPTYVDLGLPSGLLWADCNVGANSPEEYGDYFAWGETQPKRKYDWDTYKYATKYFTTPSDFIYILTKYNATDSLTILEPEDDAATMLYDNISHTPTEEEWQELIDNCTSVWTMLNGVEGRQFIGPSGDSIFLPAAGFRAESTLSQSSVVGAYHSSYIVSEDPSAYYSYYDGWVFYFHPYAYYMNDYCQRSVGRSVRAVRPAGLTFVINANANPTEGGSVSGGGSYLEGQTVTLAAIANDGYTFINWTKDSIEVSTSATYSFIVTEDADFVANFALNTYTIITTVNPTEGGTATGAGTYDYGTIITLSATPNEGYRFSRWTKNGLTVSTNASYSFIVTEDATFVANFRAYNPGEDIIQTTDFANNWNWWSSYIDLDDVEGLIQLEQGLGANGHQIKSQTKFVTNYGSMWMGQLQNIGIDNEKMYMVETYAACQVEMTGTPVNPAEHPITINENWNWIGFPSANAMSVTEALSNYTPTYGDQVKSQGKFATYYGFWMGQLQTITPGMGLMYLSNNSTPQTLVYPNVGRNSEATATTTDDLHWTSDIHAYPNNMTVMAVVELDGVELQSDNYELAAFANGECRGSAKLMYVEPLNRYMAFLTISGDEAAELNFGLYNSETYDECFESDNMLVFMTNATVGSAEEPFVVSFRDGMGINELNKLVTVYPSPVAAGNLFSIGLSQISGKVSVDIINALGSVISSETYTDTPVSLVAPKVSGVYLLRVSVEGKGSCLRKLIVK